MDPADRGGIRFCDPNSLQNLKRNRQRPRRRRRRGLFQSAAFLIRDSGGHGSNELC